MPYIGNTPAEKYAAFNVQNFTTSATTSYTLDRAVANELDIRLVINNVIQQPGAGKAYTASGTTLTLSGATTGTDTMYAVYIGKAVQTVNPGAGSVGTTALADNAVTNAKLADATQGDVIYYAAAGAPAQLSAGTNGHFLKTQGAGANPVWAAVAAGVSLTGSTNNTVATVTGANALAGETNFIYNGTIVGCGPDGANADLGTGIHIKRGDNGGTVNGNADQLVIENADAINSGNTGMSFIGSGNARICFGDAADDDVGRIMYSQGSNYMNFRTNGVEAVRIHSNQVLSAATGIALGAGTANTATNVLDDYEEGLWTPNWITEGSGGGTVTGVSTNIASYVKVGNQVTLNWYGNVQTSGTAYGYQITNLPFTQKAMAGGSGGGAGCGVSISTGGTWWIQGSQNTTNVYLKKYDDSWVPNPAVQAAFTYTID